jgi:hypothetical protein
MNVKKPRLFPFSQNAIKVFFLMIFGSFLMSISYAFQKFGLKYTSAEYIYLWARVGSLILSSLLLFNRSIRASATALIKTAKERKNLIGIILIISQEVLNLIGVYFILLAYRNGSISMVTTVASIQPFFVIVLVLILNTISKGMVPDNNTRSSVLIKLSAALLIIFGINLMIS